MPPPCPSEAELVDLFDGRSTDSAAARLTGHLDGCDACRAQVAELALAGADPQLEARVGRFSLQGVLGAGGMGLVYRARDLELGRDVALKVVRPASGESQLGGLIAEAQAMAKVSHPNVVHVYELVRHEEQIFVAMELVEGRNLRQWLEEERDLPQLLEVFRGAGAGLAAAHDAGLIHGDFKPDNVLIDSTGLARVTDFGLARVSDRSGGADDTNPAGTPAYLAPEQRAGAPANERADQFSFALSFFEALWGSRPMRGERGELLFPLRSLRPPVRAVPRWLRGILTRALSSDPTQRFPSMQAMLLRLRPRRPIALSLAASAVIAIAFGALFQKGYQVARSDEQCRQDAKRVSSLWSPTSAAEVRRAFLGSGNPAAASSFSVVDRGIKQYAAAWSRTYQSACQSDQIRECLSNGADEISALTALLKEPGGLVVENAALAMDRLSPPDRCQRRSPFHSEPRPASEPQRQAIRQLRPLLAKMKVLEVAGKPLLGLELAPRILAEAEAIGYGPVLSESWLLVGGLHFRNGAFEKARAAFEEARLAADGAGDDGHRAEADLCLIDALSRAGANQAALEQTRKAAAAVLRLGNLPELLSALQSARGRVLMGLGRPQDALTEFQQALALNEQVVDKSSSMIGSGLKDLGSAYLALGRYEEAIASLNQALENWERALGPENVVVATVLTDLGKAELALGRDAAKEHLTHALEIREHALGPDHPDVATTLEAIAALAPGDPTLPTPRAALSRALAIRRGALGELHADTQRCREALERLPSR